MTLKAYANKIVRMAEKNPNALVVYATDPECNAFYEVDSSMGMVGKFDRRSGEWDESGKTEAVCIN